MMKYRMLQNRIITAALAAALAVLMLAGCFCMRAEAAGVDFERAGQIRITLQDGETPVSGISLTIYRVGEMQLHNSLWQYELTEPFQGSGISLKDLKTPDLPQKFAAYAGRRQISGMVQKADSNGQVNFYNLPLGVYLIVQEQVPEGCLEISPFLVTVPIETESGWVYEVDASPKTEVHRKPVLPTSPPKPILPQTGQLNWPVPVLTLAGIFLFLIGLVLYYKKDANKDEA